MLAELSELGLTLARELHARALAAETPQEAEKLALAFQRVSRGVRQTFALELKIERDRRQADREIVQDAAATAKAGEPIISILGRLNSPTARRKDRVRGALARLIWDEAEGDECEIEVLNEDLEARLDEAAMRTDFLDLPIETLIRQIKADMDLSGDLVITACEAPKPPAPDPGAFEYDAAPPNTG